MSKHTPGPWIIELDNPNDIVSNVYDVEICTIQPVDIGGRKMWDYGEITKANVNLIAAAPDLLEACEEYIGVLRSRIRDGKVRLEHAEAMYQAECKILAAIAKARGESK